MALQTTGQLKLSEIQTEFGGTSPISLSEYYAGGAYVLSGTGYIPSSAMIEVSHFLGTQAIPNYDMTSHTRSAGATAAQVYASCTDCTNDTASMNVRVFRGSNGTTSYLQVRRIEGTTISTWWSTNGTQNALGTSYTNLGTMTGQAVTAFKLYWTGADNPTSSGDSTYFVSNNSWRTLAAGQSMGGRWTASASNTGIQGDVDTDYAGGNFKLYARGTNFLDTLIMDIDLSIGASATATDSGCFPPGSKVTMSDGSTKAIETVQVGDVLLGNGGVHNTVLSLRPHEARDRFLFTINGKITTTEGHPILTEDGWKAFDPESALRIHPEMEIEQIQIGQYLTKYTNDGRRYTELVEEITDEIRTVSLYNFDVTGNDTYIVEGVVVHNK